MWTYNYSTELCHKGVKGMKWDQSKKKQQLTEAELLAQKQRADWVAANQMELAKKEASKSISANSSGAKKVVGFAKKAAAKEKAAAKKATAKETAAKKKAEAAARNAERVAIATAKKAEIAARNAEKIANKKASTSTNAIENVATETTVTPKVASSNSNDNTIQSFKDMKDISTSALAAIGGTRYSELLKKQ